MQLLHPPIYNENDDIVGYGDSLITKKEAMKLLNKK
jgi:hypothetical protein